MKHEPFIGESSVQSRVEWISQDRVSEGLKMYAELVCAPGYRKQSHQRIGTPVHCDDFVSRLGVPGARGGWRLLSRVAVYSSNHGESNPVPWVPGEGTAHDGGGRGKHPLHHRQVLLTRGVGLELINQPGVILFRSCHDHDTTRFLVQAMHNSRAIFRNGTMRVEAEEWITTVPSRQCVDEGAADGAVAGMNYHPLGLVENQKVGMLLNNIKGNIFCRGGNGVRNIEGDGDHLSGVNASRGFHGNPLPSQARSVSFEGTPRELRHMAHDALVHPKPFIVTGAVYLKRLIHRGESRSSRRPRI